MSRPLPLAMPSAPLHLLNTDSLRDITLQLFSRGLLHVGPTSAPSPTSVTAAPTPVKLQDYLAIKALQPAINLVLDRAAHDKAFIVSNLAGIGEHDPFVKGFLDIYSSLPPPPPDQITLGLFRHDYMYATAGNPTAGNPSAQEEPCNPATLGGQYKLVEFNTVCASMGSLADGVFRYHQRLLNKHGLDTAPFSEEVRNARGYCEGLCRAHQLYQTKHGSSACVIVVVLEDLYEFNYFDQELLINEVEARSVPTCRYTTAYLLQHGRLDSGKFWVDGREVSVFYFRTMYHPNHFPTPDYWRLRRDMEHSAALTVPTIPHQIINMKLFQMLLSQREVLERYTDSKQADALLNTFCATLPLTMGQQGDDNARLARENPEKYVLKPQREGGGNNYWGQEMVEKLEELRDHPARGGYILMEKITPPCFINRFIKNGSISAPTRTVSELGYYSVLCKQGEDILLNSVAGSLVRTKDTDANEGGIAVGISSVDSPYFV